MKRTALLTAAAALALAACGPAQVVVTAVYPKFILATAVEGADAIVVGAAVRFVPSKEERK